jgi:hypothetical protein
MAAALSALLSPPAFDGTLNDVPPALADPAPSGAEEVQVVNGDFSGVGAGALGTPPTNHNFETAGATVGSPPPNHGFSNGFTDWTLTGSPSIQSGGPGGNYTQLGPGHKALSSAFTLDTRAQIVTLNVAAVNTGTFQWKLNVYSGPTFATKTTKFYTSCPTTCTTWSAYSLDVMAWAPLGQPIKIELERFLGDLKVDDVGVGQEILAGWTPTAGDKVSLPTGGPTGAYGKTSTTIISSAFTVDAEGQNAEVDLRVESASGSYGIHVLSGTGYGYSKSEIRSAPAIVLTKDQHDAFTRQIRTQMPYGTKWDRDKVWSVYKNVYSKHSDWLDSIRPYFGR